MEKYLVWVEQSHSFGVLESMSQCFCPVFFGNVDEGSGCCEFVYVKHPSASCFAVVSAAFSRTAHIVAHKLLLERLMSGAT